MMTVFVIQDTMDQNAWMSVVNVTKLVLKVVVPLIVTVHQDLMEIIVRMESILIVPTPSDFIRLKL